MLLCMHDVFGVDRQLVSGDHLHVGVTCAQSVVGKGDCLGRADVAVFHKSWDTQTERHLVFLGMVVCRNKLFPRDVMPCTDGQTPGVVKK